jgi:hypothetical protein
MSHPIASLHGLNFVPRPANVLPTNPATAARFDASRAFLGDTLGLTKLGVNVTAVKPGKTAYPFHSHRANDELFLILAGSGEPGRRAPCRRRRRPDRLPGRRREHGSPVDQHRRQRIALPGGELGT